MPLVEQLVAALDMDTLKQDCCMKPKNQENSSPSAHHCTLLSVYRVLYSGAIYPLIKMITEANPSLLQSFDVA